MADVTTAAASSLLASLVDYAGLFPPAGLEMEEAVEEYARHRRSPERWILGRFVVPARRLTEMETAAAPYLPTLGAADPWRISALLGTGTEDDVAQAVSLGQRLRGQAVVDSVELKAGTPAEVESALALLPPRLTAYVELPIDADLPPLLAAVKARGARAKVRTGGVTPSAIPSSASVARFLVACASARVPFKATAGLHHAIRATRRLTYAADSPSGTMHGFLNVFTAAGLAWQGAPAEAVEAVLQDENPGTILVDARGLSAGDRRLSPGDLAACRGQFAMSFGSCSFVEPVADLKALGIL